MNVGREPKAERDAGRDVLAGTSYQVVKLLGSGGMGKVYLASHRLLGSHACVKVLHDGLDGHEAALDRFRLEAQALANLGGGKHPHLVHVRDFGVTATGQPFLAMEYLEGRTLLDERKARGEIPWVDACRWVIQALRGVGVAHKAGMVHRDLKTANLFLCRDADDRPLVKVLDFGIVKLLSSAQVAPLAIPTATGLMIGTPRYASPEQVSGGTVDPRSDLYSLGLVLHELVSGEPPYADRKKEHDLMAAQALDPLPVTSSRAKQQVPRVLDNIIRKATEKDAADRYQDAADFAAALEQLVGPLPARQPRVSPRPPHVGRRDTSAASAEEKAAFAAASDRTEPGEPLFLGDRAPAPVAPGPGSITKAEAAARRARSRGFFAVAIVSTLVFFVAGAWALLRLLP